MTNLPTTAAIVIGATGGIGQALAAQLTADSRYPHVVALSRTDAPALDLVDEASIASAAAEIGHRDLDIRLIIVATGALARHGCVAEKSLAQIDPTAMARSFAINTIGPALVLKHFTPLLPKRERAVVVLLSARVGSIGDNRLGGWYAYRAAKAALNQIVRSAAIELHRTRPDAICVALHPGTVDTALGTGFAKTGLDVQTPTHAAQKLLAVIDDLKSADSGGFFDHTGAAIIW